MRHRRVGNQVANGVAPGERRQPQNAVGETEDDPEGLQQADQLVGNDVDPDDGHAEADEAEQGLVDRRLARSIEIRRQREEDLINHSRKVFFKLFYTWKFFFKYSIPGGESDQGGEYCAG